MKLYLSSYLLGDHADKLLEMAGGSGARMVILTNALDTIPLKAQLEYTRSQFDAVAYFAEHGFDPSPMDLRFYFGRPAALKDALRRHRVIWALGGNTFVLRRAMRESGFDHIIRELLSEDVIYAGWSAGACVAGTSLRPIASMDEPDAIAPGYPQSGPLWEGLGLVPFSIIPHHDSQHPESAAAAEAVALALSEGIAHKALRDGEALVMEGAALTVLPRLS